MSNARSRGNSANPSAHKRGVSPHLGAPVSWTPSMARAPSCDLPQNSSRAASPGGSPISTGRFPTVIQVVSSKGRNLGSPLPSHRGRLQHAVGRSPFSHTSGASLADAARGIQARGVRQASQSPPPPQMYAEPITDKTRKVTPVPARAESAPRAAQVMPLSPGMHYEAAAHYGSRVQRLSSGHVVVPVGNMKTGPVGAPSMPAVGQSGIASCPNVGVGVHGMAQIIQPQVMVAMQGSKAQSVGTLPIVSTAPVPNSVQQAATGPKTAPALMLNEQQSPMTVVAVAQGTQTTARKSHTQNMQEAQTRQILAEGERQREELVRMLQTAHDSELKDLREKLRREEETHERAQSNLQKVSQDYSHVVSENARLLEQAQREGVNQETLKAWQAKCMEFESKYVEEQKQKADLDKLHNRRLQEVQEMLSRSEKNREMLMDEKVAIEAQKDKIADEIRERDDANRDLQARNVALQSELQNAQRQVMQSENETRSWYERHCAADKEKQTIITEQKVTITEQKRIIANLEAKLRSKEQDNSCLQTPGDLIKHMKAQQEDKENQSAQNLARQNSELKKELAKRQVDLENTLRKVKEQAAQLNGFAASH